MVSYVPLRVAARTQNATVTRYSPVVIKIGFIAGESGLGPLRLWTNCWSTETAWGFLREEKSAVLIVWQAAARRMPIERSCAQSAQEKRNAGARRWAELLILVRRVIRAEDKMAVLRSGQPNLPVLEIGEESFVLGLIEFARPKDF